MRSQKILKEKIWDIKKKLAKTEPGSTAFAVHTGIIMGLQWALGVNFDEKTGDILSGIACGAVIQGKKNADI